VSFQAQAIQEGKSLSVAGFEFRVLETPGHSNDSVCFLHGQLLFTGDTLSAGTIGDTSGGFERALLLTSIRRKLLTLGQDVFVFPGHGPPTRMEVERRFNPFLVESL
jgi:glyoxylase-like metal-dependent hydrolase (beta-lactamase superfamily II)